MMLRLPSLLLRPLLPLFRPFTSIPIPPPSQPLEKPSSTSVSSPPKKIPIILDDNDIEEAFVKGSGPGGQKINKCRHNVQLVHKPTGIRVECQRFRELHLNRREARKILKSKLDELMNGPLSNRQQKIAKLQKQKAKAKKRALKKYGTKGDEECEGRNDGAPGPSD